MASPCARLGLVMAVVSLLAAPAALAQTFPARPVRVVVPFTPGGPTDILARALVQRLTERWGQQLVVDNRGGGGGNIGAEIVVRALPDGHTLLLATAGILAVNPSLFMLPYDTQRDFAPIGQVANITSILVVHPSMPVRSATQFVEHARRQPGKISYGSAGHGTASHLATELLKLKAGLDLRHVPYKGAAPAVTDLVAGHIGVMLIGVPVSLPQVRAGRLVALGVASAKRSPTAPDLPTLSEAGLLGIEVDNWFALVAPARLPPTLAERISADVREIVSAKDFRDRLLAQGFDAGAGTPMALAESLRQETAKWSAVVREAGIRAD